MPARCVSQCNPDRYRCCVAAPNAELLATTEQVQQLQQEGLRGAVAAATAGRAMQEPLRLFAEKGGEGKRPGVLLSSDVQWQHTYELQAAVLGRWQR